MDQELPRFREPLPEGRPPVRGRSPVSRPAPTVTIVARRDETVRALEAYLCDVGVPSRRLASVTLDRLLALDTQAAVVLVDDFELSDLLPTLKALHSQRPALALVLVAGR